MDSKRHNDNNKKNDKETIKNDNSINKLKLIPKPEFNNNPNSI
jgi:hypothetical protein